MIIFRDFLSKFGKSALVAAQAGAFVVEELEQVRATIAAKSRQSFWSRLGWF